MSFETFNKEKNKQFLNDVYDRINKKFNTDRGKAITDYLIQLAEPFLYGFSLEKMLRDLIIRDLDEFCEKQEATTVEEFEQVAIGFTKHFCFAMNDINAPLF